ncbi:MAG TPA: tol-pal system protein YbgF [Thermoanaerobaculia bacterium]|nr:tol-pal system protein YbgF [Thermoanaerobaculia bacterium]
MRTLRLLQQFRLLALAAAALAAAGCVSTSDFERAQDQIAELQEELANVRRTTAGKEEVQGVNVRIAEQTETLLRSNATLVTKVADIEERMQNTHGSTEQTNYRLDQLAQQLTQARADIESLRTMIASMQQQPAAVTAPAGTSGSEVVVPAPPAVPAGNPMETYNAALRDYQRGNYDLAIEGFREFLDASPQSELADNAAYWIGESLFSQKKYRDAIQQFDSVVNSYPRSDKVPGALLKKGFAYISVGERAQGVVQLQYVLHEHPRSQEAALARQRLKQLGIETR